MKEKRDRGLVSGGCVSRKLHGVIDQVFLGEAFLDFVLSADFIELHVSAALCILSSSSDSFSLLMICSLLQSVLKQFSDFGIDF